MSQTYIFHDQAGSIPGVPHVFAHCIVEVNDDGSYEVLQLPLAQHPLVVEATIEPVGAAEITSEGDIPVEPIQEQPIEPEPVQEEVPEPENTNQE